MKAGTALERLAARLRGMRGETAEYAVPGLWANPAGTETAAVKVDPAAFYGEVVERILRGAPKALAKAVEGERDWGSSAVAYNLLVRYGAAFDHDGDGNVRPAPMANGWRETGTFLKATAMLPYIAALGCNTVHLLPVTSIGHDGNKGDMGSAFAIRDPYALDENLGEPAVGLGAEEEFAAFTEAAHRLGIRVVTEFVFRTAAKDAAWAGEHPEWFYWIREDVRDRRPGERSEDTYGAPLFAPEELKVIYDAVGQGRFGELLPPHEVYRRMFLPPPPKESVRMEGGRWIGESRDPETGAAVRVRIPGAFCDWGPDSEQPPWGDVTYLRLYDHPDYNYIAYNTVRMYAAELARKENAVEGLWEKISEVIPHYQRRFGVDGVMIDMGHALPGELKRRLLERARAVDGNFALWAEEFDLKEESRREGVSVCVGPFMQTARNPEHLQGWLRWLGQTGVPVPFMAMGENHNTPRANHWAGGNRFSLYVQTMGAFLPGVPYFHNGIEIGERRPVNTGFDFTAEETAELPAEKLPLFSAQAMDWTGADTELLGKLRRMLAVRAEWAAVAGRSCAESIEAVWGGDGVGGYVRHGATGERLTVVGNGDMAQRRPLSVPGLAGQRNLLTGEPVGEWLEAGDVVVVRGGGAASPQ